jgi:3-methyladenine DNA glycosylase AlkD
MMTDNSQAIIARAVASLPEALDDLATALIVIEGVFKALSDEEYQQGVSTTVPGAMHVYGVRVPELRAFAGALAKRYRPDTEALCALALATWDVGSREHQLLAIFLLGRAKLSPLERWRVGNTLLPDVDNWEACDQLCSHLLGEALAADPTYMDRLEGWLDHPDFWQRRAALVSTVLLRRFKGPADQAETLDRRALAMCEALLDDPEPYVAKAVDWAVREAIKRHPALGAAWMVEQAEKGLPRRARSTLKKSAKKLAPDERARFLGLLETNP